LVPGTLSVARRAPAFAAVDEQGAIDVFGLGSLRLLRRLRAPGADFDDVALTPDGRMAAATTADGWLWFWDLGTGRPRHPAQPAHGTAAWVVSADGRGRWLASGGYDDVVRIWDARRGVTVRTALPGSAGDLSLSPDGRTLAVTFANRNFSGGLQLLSVPGLRPLRTLPLPAGTSGRFSTEGGTLLYGDQRGRLWTIGTRDWRVRRGPLATNGGRVVGTALSPDGRSVAVISGDGTGTLWDLTSSPPLGAPLPGGPEDVVGAAFVDGGKRLLVLRRHGGTLWDPRPQDWIRRACAVAGRTLTRAEWRNGLADRPYAPACVTGR
jgi:WD40 repeat protein